MLLNLVHVIKAKGLHWDDSPFGACLPLCDAVDVPNIMSGTEDDRHYWTRQIIEKKKPIKEKFDLRNYIKRAFEKPSRITNRPMTAKERLAEKRLWAELGF